MRVYFTEPMKVYCIDIDIQPLILTNLTSHHGVEAGVEALVYFLPHEGVAAVLEHVHEALDPGGALGKLLELVELLLSVLVSLQTLLDHLVL